MTKLTLRGPALERAAARLGIPLSEEPKSSPVTPQEARRLRRDAVRAFHKRLAADCPAVFAPPHHAPPVPLAIGTDAAIAARYRDVPKRTRKLFLAEYTRQPGYLHRLTKPGAVRLDLDGNPAEIVTEDQSQNAAERLAARAAGNKPHDGGKP